MAGLGLGRRWTGPGRTAGRLASALVAAAGLIAGTLSTVQLLPAPAQAAGLSGCGYGSTGAQAGALCWLDMSGYNQSLADGAAGQAMSVSLPGGYTISFTIRTGPFNGKTYNPVAPTAFPTWSNAYLGNRAYIGTPGKPALYATGNGGAATVTLSGISVKDAAGTTITGGYGFVTADAETTNASESLTFGSNVPLNAISTSTAQYPYCGGGLTGLGTTTVTCQGANNAGTSGAYGALVVQANAPSTISASMVNGGKQGVAFALVVSQIQLTKTVVGRINPTDSFNISVTSPEGTVLGAASTGTANTATTGQLTVLPVTGGGAYTLSETATPGTPTVMANYTQSWSCTNNGATSPSLPSGGGTSKTVIPAPGDAIACVVTNTANIAPAISIGKTASPTTVSTVGQVVTYTFRVTNTGNVSLSGVGVTDTQAAPASALTTGPTCGTTTLAAGGATTCTATYTATQADLDNGSITDTATATGTPASGPAVTSAPSSATVSVTQTGSLALTKTPSPGTVSAVGQTVTYTFRVTNNSNVTVTGLSVADSQTGPAGNLDGAPSCGTTTLAPAAATTCTATYTVTQADLNNGSIKDSAVATGRTAGGATLTSNPASATVTAVQTPAVAVIKTASPTTVTTVGQIVTYRFSVTNTGNVTLTAVRVNDSQIAPAGSLTSGPTCTATTLDAGASTTCTATYTVTQADLNNGSINDTATATGTPPSLTPVTSAPSSASVTATQTGTLALTKTASPTTVSAVGQRVTYTFTVTNRTNVRVANVAVTDTQAFPAGPLTSGPTCTATALEPAASTTCTATYTITQADLDDGSLVDFATATATTGTGTTLTSNTATATVTATQTPGVKITKTASPTTVTTVGQIVTYTFVVTNTGNVTLTGLAVADTQAAPAGTLGGLPSCAATTLAPGTSTTCTASYAVTQADLDSGTINDTATATAIPPSGSPITSAPSSASVAATQTGTLALTKTPSPTSVSSVGDIVTYTFRVTNNSNVTVTGVSIADTQTAPAGPLTGKPVCDSTSLSPGGTATCTATYSVTQADIDHGSVDDTATATARTPSNALLTSNPAAAMVATTQAPELKVTKTANPSVVTAVGQIVTYTFAVTNTGNVSLTNVHVNDSQAAPAGSLSSGPSCPTTTLAPGDSTNCTATYAVTQADLDNRSINDSATATGTPPTGPETTSSPSSASVSVAEAGALTLSKAAAPTTVTAAGQTVTYTFTVTNTGNVTVTGVQVTDTQTAPAGVLASGPTCLATALGPGANTTCTATYTVSQADVDNGSIDDSAIATATPPSGGTLTSNPATAAVQVDQNPDIAIAKTANPTTVTAAGQTVTYTFVVTNTGNVTLSGVGVLDTQAPPAGALTTGPTCMATTLAPNATTTCIATYTVLQTDMDNGSINDSAVASVTSPTGTTITSDPAIATVTATQTAAIAIAKTANPTTVTGAGQHVTYTFTVTNTGNVTLSGVSVSDTPAPPAGNLNAAPSCPLTTLAPGDSTNCTATYTVTQSDMDNGSINDSASASGIAPVGKPINSAPSSASVTTVQTGSLALTKTASPSTVTSAGQKVTYSFVVTNNTNVTVRDVAVSDTQSAPAGSLASGPTCDSTTLAPSETATCLATYTVTQTDIDHGSIDDTALATATSPTGASLQSNTGAASVTVIQSPAVAITKTANPTIVTSAGQSVTYTFVVTNTGDVTLTNVHVNDSQATPAGSLSTGPSCPTTTLAPGASTNCTATYTVTQADIDNGSIDDSATATADAPIGGPVTSPPSSAAVGVTATPSLTLTKTADPDTVTTAGQTVTYTFVVTNTGNLTLTDVGVTDSQTAPAGALPTEPTCTSSTLAPGATTLCIATYTVTQVDIDHGSVKDTAVATGSAPDGSTVTSDPASATVTVEQVPGLSITKTASPLSVSSVGQSVSYTFVVTNTGNVTMTDLNVRDTEAKPAGALTTEPSCTTDTLAPGATTTCTATYTLAQDDLDNGSINDTAVATGDPPIGPTFTSGPSSATVTAIQTGSLVLTKTASPTAVNAAGAIVAYTFAVTNDTNVTVSDVTIDDTQAPPARSLTTGPTCPSGDVVPGLTVLCVGTYTVTQTDVDHGSIDDSAVATATSPAGATLTSNPAAAAVTATQTPGVSITKTANPSTVTAAGQTVTYTFAVTNTGNVTLTDLSVADTQVAPAGALTSGPTCPLGIVPPAYTGTLAPGFTADCTATYTVTQADMDNGSINDTATATATPPSNVPITSAESTASVTATPAPALTIDKTAEPTTVTAAGQTVHYTFLVTNTGNVTLNDVAVDDTQTAPAGSLDAAPICDAGSLTPAAFTTCTASYTVTQADMDHGSIHDTAVATGAPPTGPAIESPPSAATVTATQTPGIELTKAAAPTTVTAAGDVVTYTFAVTNTGNVTLDGLHVTDTQTAPASALTSGPTCPSPTLAPGTTEVCTGSYTSTQADIDHGSIHDVAIATAASPRDIPVISLPAPATVTATQAPGIALTKSADPTTVTAAGDTIAYTFAVTNTGNVTLSDLSVADVQMAPAGPLTAGPTCLVSTVAPGATVDCTASYTMTQADMDNGSINDTATATATTPDRIPISSAASSATVTATQTPAISLTKTASPTIVSDVGQTVTYTFEVTNSGNVTLSDIEVGDVQAAPAGPLTSPPACDATILAPGDHTTCTATYTVTQADINHGSIDDTATATGTGPGATTVTSNEATATVTATQLNLTKTASPTEVTAAGQTVTYTFVVTNTGEADLSDVSVADAQAAPAGSLTSGPTCPPTTSLAPGDTVTCSATYTVTQADIDHGSIDDTATATALASNGHVITSNPAPATVTATQSPGIDLSKSASPTTVSSAGQIVSYTFAVTNTGNVTLTDLQVTDTQTSPAGKLSRGPTCPTGTLAPGDKTTCTGTYTVTQADINNGSIHDTAVATANPAVDPPVTSRTAEATVTAVQAAAITLHKTASPVAITAAGQIVSYTFAVTNTGNVTLSSISVTDTQTAPAGKLTTGPTCPRGSLAPGATADCTATYTVTDADLNQGSISDRAVADGMAPGGRAVASNASSVTVTATPGAELAAVNAAPPPAAVNSSNSPPLAATGAPIVQEAKTAATLLLAGTGLSVMARRRRRRQGRTKA